MANWIETLVEEVAALTGVEEVTVADESGCYVAGANNTDPDETAAITTFTGRSALTTGDILALEELQYVSLIGKKHKMLVFSLASYMLGVRLGPDAIISKLESRLAELVPAALEEA